MANKKKRTNRKSNANKAAANKTNAAATSTTAASTTPAPTTTTAPANTKRPTKSKPICKFLLEGRCTKGDACTFLHTPNAIAAGEKAAAARAASEKKANSPEKRPVTPTSGFTPKNEKSKKNGVNIPEGLSASLSLFTPEQQQLAKSLCEADQCHLFEKWTTDLKDEEINAKKIEFMSTLQSINKSYPTNLTCYLTNARTLLEKSSRGINPLEGWVPSVPIGESFEVGTNEFWEAEERGLGQVGKCGFVLVAGGLGERLGYGDIKIGLPTELCTSTSYIQFYIETILAYQSRYAPNTQLPLCIMTSNDTNDKTVALLKNNNYFGMKESQITIVKQGLGVPALTDNAAHIALSDDHYQIQLKPHGHGDIHSLLHTSGTASSWLAQGLKWIVFFQDTNGLAFHSLALALGVSTKLGLVMNSICCPRRAGQAIGGIARLRKGEESRTINVEYNQLDPLLRASGSEGDVNDESGYSPYPGNINQLLFRLEDYVDTLQKTQGIMPEFVNPKYADANKTIFKKPTRLECMMQDFPTVLTGPAAEKVGFTTLPSEMCFSPVKNATVDGVALQSKGTHPGVAATGEADQSGAARRLLRSIGCVVEEGVKAKFSGIEVVVGPDVVLKPSFAVCSTELKKKFPNPPSVKISGRSSLVVKGDGLVIESLDLDGALVIECEDGASGVIRDLNVVNKGWVKVPDDNNESEIVKMRGYYIDKLETQKIVFKKDGSVEGYTPSVEEKGNEVKQAPILNGTRDNNTMQVLAPTSKEQNMRSNQKQEAAKSPVSDVVEKKEKAAPTPHAENKKVASREISQDPATNPPVANPAVVESKIETVVDLSKPASSEEKEKDQLCGGACVIL